MGKVTRWKCMGMAKTWSGICRVNIRKAYGISSMATYMRKVKHVGNEPNKVKSHGD